MLLRCFSQQLLYEYANAPCDSIHGQRFAIAHNKYHHRRHRRHHRRVLMDVSCSGLQSVHIAGPNRDHSIASLQSISSQQSRTNLSHPDHPCFSLPINQLAAIREQFSLVHVSTKTTHPSTLIKWAAPSPGSPRFQPRYCSNHYYLTTLTLTSQGPQSLNYS